MKYWSKTVDLEDASIKQGAKANPAEQAHVEPYALPKFVTETDVVFPRFIRQ